VASPTQTVQAVPYSVTQLLNESTATRFIGPGQPHEGDLTYWKLYCTLAMKAHMTEVFIS
jgi:hypothetical protein